MSSTMNRISTLAWSSCLRRLNLPRNFFTYTNQIAQPIKGKEPVYCTGEEAVKQVKSGNCVFVQGAAATPTELLNCMAEHAKCNQLKDIVVCHMHTEGKLAHCEPEFKGVFRDVSFFMGGNVRKAVAEGRADAIPIFLHEIPLVFTKGLYKPDVSLIHVSPPDRHGYCSLGTSVDIAVHALSHSKLIIALVNPKMPRTFGQAPIHQSHIDYAVCIDRPLPIHPQVPLSPEEEKIGTHIANELVKDGATLQMGIGNIPDAVLAKLHNHKDLGIHTEMFSSGIPALVRSGAVTNNQKPFHTGKIIGSFFIGTQELYDFVDDNPFIELLNIYYVNHTSTIRQMPKMTAINSAIEIDITGQVCADSIGTRMFSGFGGQVDFIRGAGEGVDGLGVPIIAFAAATKKGVSKIVPTLKEGAGVVTSRAHAQYIVTEHGIARLWGKTLRQRAYELIKIADPKSREALEKAAFDRLKEMPCA